ncbi:MAG: polysaccharide biosynthesis/export family protein [Phormidesmis sp.]
MNTPRRVCLKLALALLGLAAGAPIGQAQSAYTSSLSSPLVAAADESTPAIGQSVEADTLPTLTPRPTPTLELEPVPLEPVPLDTIIPDPALPISTSYILGPGDKLQIAVFGAPDYSGDFTVLSDGTLNLPVAGSVNVQGLTLAQATDSIRQQYGLFIRRPLVTVAPLLLRPLRIGIAGAVQRPGTYTIAIETDEGGNRFPTLTDAIELAGGISSRADIRNIQINRIQQPGQNQVVTANLWEILQGETIEEDFLLQSGDTIVIPEATALDPQEAILLGEASFSPDTVTVYVVGEVVSPGDVEVPPNTPLNQAILAAGGFDSRRANDEEVVLVRLNEDGSVIQRPIEVDFTQGVDEEVNPTLKEKDVIVVQRSGLASFSDTTSLALSPVGRILSAIFGVFNIFD